MEVENAERKWEEKIRTIEQVVRHIYKRVDQNSSALLDETTTEFTNLKN